MPETKNSITSESTERRKTLENAFRGEYSVSKGTLHLLTANETLYELILSDTIEKNPDTSPNLGTAKMSVKDKNEYRTYLSFWNGFDPGKEISGKDLRTIAQYLYEKSNK